MTNKEWYNSHTYYERLAGERLIENQRLYDAHVDQIRDGLPLDETPAPQPIELNAVTDVKGFFAALREMARQIKEGKQLDSCDIEDALIPYSKPADLDDLADMMGGE